MLGFWVPNHNPANIRLSLHQHFDIDNSLMAKYNGQMLYFDDLKIGMPSVNEIFPELDKTPLDESVSYRLTHHIYLQVYLYTYDQNDAANPCKKPFLENNAFN